MPYGDALSQASTCDRERTWPDASTNWKSLASSRAVDDTSPSWIASRSVIVVSSTALISLAAGLGVAAALRRAAGLRGFDRGLARVLERVLARRLDSALRAGFLDFLAVRFGLRTGRFIVRSRVPLASRMGYHSATCSARFPCPSSFTTRR